MVYQLSQKDDKLLRKGSWLEEEDERLSMFVSLLGERRWDSLAKVSGLRRSGKSCRLRWLNYLRPNLKHGGISEEEEKIILQLHSQWGNKWSKIARRLQGRTDNEIKNYWKTHLRKKVQAEEQEKLGINREVSDQDLVLPGCNDDSRFQKLDLEGSGNDEVSETEKQTDVAAHEIENFAMLSSPYETRISDWISELSTDQTEPNHYNEYSSSSSTDSCFLNSWWVSDDNIDLEEFSCSLW